MTLQDGLVAGWHVVRLRPFCALDTVLVSTVIVLAMDLFDLSGTSGLFELRDLLLVRARRDALQLGREQRRCPSRARRSAWASLISIYSVGLINALRVVAV